MEENQVLETEVLTSDTQNNDAPTTTEEAKVEVEKQEPETVTLTKEQLEQEKNAIAKKEREKAERRQRRAEEALRAEFNQKFESMQQPKQAPTGAPKLDDYETYDEFVRATVRYETAEAKKQWDEQQSADRENQNRQKINQAHLDRADKFRKEMPDFDDVLGNLADFDTNGYSPQLTETISAALLTSEISPQLMHYFGKNMDEFERIHELSPIAAAREIGKIEAKLLATPIQKSSAPPPITPVNATSQSKKDPSDMSDAEWYESERKKRKK